jgi:hypothetical protein
MFHDINPNTPRGQIKTPLNYVFIVVRNNVVETVKVFTEMTDAIMFTDNFIMECDKAIRVGDLPKYHSGESYSKDGLTVGLHICPSNFIADICPAVETAKWVAHRI